MGVVAVLLIGYISVNTVRTRGVGSAGLRPGSALPQFAAPLATGPLPDGDVNVARKAGQGDAGARPACSVRGAGRPELLRPRARRARGDRVPRRRRGAQCTGEIDALARAARAPPGREAGGGRRSAAIAATLRRLVAHATAGASRSPGTATASWRTSRRRGLPAADLRAAAAAGCRARALGALDGAALDARLRALERAARARGWRP